VYSYGEIKIVILTSLFLLAFIRPWP